MELKNIKNKIGSDPCMVLEYDADGAYTLTSAQVNATLYQGVNDDDARAWATAFTDIVRRALKTRQVVLKLHIKRNTSPVSYEDWNITQFAIVPSTYGDRVMASGVFVPGSGYTGRAFALKLETTIDYKVRFYTSISWS